MLGRYSPLGSLPVWKDLKAQHIDDIDYHLNRHFCFKTECLIKQGFVRTELLSFKKKAFCKKLNLIKTVHSMFKERLRLC